MLLEGLNGKRESTENRNPNGFGQLTKQVADFSKDVWSRHDLLEEPNHTCQTVEIVRRELHGPFEPLDCC